MVKRTTTRSIIFTIITMISILTLTLPNIILDGFSQTLIPGFSSSNIESTSKGKILTDEIFIKVQLVPHENNYLKDWYQVSNFSFVTSNTSKLCSSDLCKYKLENGKMTEASNLGERSLTGKFNVDTAMSNELMNLSSIWKAVEELEEDGKFIQVIEGTLSLDKDTFQPEHKYQINGTLSKNNDNYFLEIKGKK
jgi:hypothetical protein